MAFGRLALHTWTLDTTPLTDALAAARAGGFDGVELRRVDFTRSFKQGLSNTQVIESVQAVQIPVHMIGCEYGWLFAEGDESRRLFAVLDETCRNAVALGCPTIMCAPGPNAGPLRQAIENLKRGADNCGSYGLQLALEFNFQHPAINGIAPLRELVHGVGRTNFGMLLDSYHLQRSGEGVRGLAGIAPGELFAFQYSDAPPTPLPEGDPRGLDRLPPGKGVVPWAEVFELLAAKGFDGYLSYEAPNPLSWARDPLAVCREAVEATRSFIAAALGRRRPH